MANETRSDGSDRLHPRELKKHRIFTPDRRLCDLRLGRTLPPGGRITASPSVLHRSIEFDITSERSSASSTLRCDPASASVFSVPPQQDVNNRNGTVAASQEAMTHRARQSRRQRGSICSRGCARFSSPELSQIVHEFIGIASGTLLEK